MKFKMNKKEKRKKYLIFISQNNSVRDAREFKSLNDAMQYANELLEKYEATSDAKCFMFKEINFSEEYEITKEVSKE